MLSIVDQLNERFETVDLGGARFLLGMGINRDRAAGTILLEQEAYTNAVLDKFGMADARPTTSPSEAGPVSVLEDEVLSAEDTTYFRSATGSLLYLSRCTRPDITHSVMVLTRSMAKLKRSEGDAETQTRTQVPERDDINRCTLRRGCRRWKTSLRRLSTQILQAT